MLLTDLKGLTIVNDERGTVNGTLHFAYVWSADGSELLDVQCKMPDYYAHLPLSTVINLSNFIERDDREFTIGGSVKVRAFITAYNPNEKAFIVRRLDE